MVMNKGTVINYDIILVSGLCTVEGLHSCVSALPAMVELQTLFPAVIVAMNTDTVVNYKIESSEYLLHAQ